MTTYNTVSINELERKNSTWFSENNRRFFKSMWDSYALQNEGSTYAYFVSSEKHVSYSSGINEPRKYTIRKFNMRNGKISNNKDGTIFEFKKYTTKAQAEKALRKHLKTEPIRDDMVNFLNAEIEQLTYQIKRTQDEIVNLKTELETLTCCNKCKHGLANHGTEGNTKNVRLVPWEISTTR